MSHGTPSEKWDFGVEDFMATKAESVVRAEVDRRGIYVYSLLNATIRVAALAVFSALRLCRVKALYFLDWLLHDMNSVYEQLWFVFAFYSFPNSYLFYTGVIPIVLGPHLA